MKKETYICDVCVTERKDANHWFMAAVVKDADCIVINPETPDEHCFERPSLIFHKWSDFAKNDPRMKHICGQVCAHKLLDEFLSK